MDTDGMDTVGMDTDGMDSVGMDTEGTRTAGPWTPVDACTLPTVEQPVRVAEFDALFATSLRAVDSAGTPPTRTRLVLAGDEGLAARVQQLADAESACCSFFSFAVTPVGGDPDGTVVALDVEVPPARADVLAALVARAHRALPSS
jgi:hypothetical protein